MSLYKKSVKPSSEFLKKLGHDEPLFYLPNGRAVYSVLGGAEDNPMGEGDDPKGDDDKTDDDDTDKDDVDDKKDDVDDTDKGKSEPVSREEFDRIMRRMQAADRRADAAEAKVKEFTDKDKSELERATEQADTFKQENEGLKKDVRDLRIQLAFATSNGYSWQDPEDVLTEVNKNLDKIEISDAGVVDKKTLKSVLDDIAKRKPHWIKPTGNGSSGEPGPGRSNNHKDEAAERKRIESKFPAVRRRR